MKSARKPTGCGQFPGRAKLGLSWREKQVHIVGPLHRGIGGTRTDQVITSREVLDDDRVVTRVAVLIAAQRSPIHLVQSHIRDHGTRDHEDRLGTRDR